MFMQGAAKEKEPCGATSSKAAEELLTSRIIVYEPYEFFCSSGCSFDSGTGSSHIDIRRRGIERGERF